MLPMVTIISANRSANRQVAQGAAGQDGAPLTATLTVIPLPGPAETVGPFTAPPMAIVPVDEPVVVMEPPCTGPLTLIRVPLLPAVRARPAHRAVTVMSPMTEPSVVMKPPSSVPFTLMIVLLLPAEIVGPFIGPLIVMLPMTDP